MGRSARNLKHFKLCFSKTKYSPVESESLPTSPTPSHDHYQINKSHHNPPPCPISSSPSPSNIMIKTFNSLYEPQPQPEPADLATALASQRFFFSSPGHSNSLIECTTTKSECNQQQHLSLVEGDDNGDKKKNKVLLFKGSVAVPTFSPDPYQDFRRSMQEMVEARPELMMDVNSNWNVLHQLLLCYLALNPKTTHNFIISAFSDLLISLMDVTI